ncbi:Uncharacterised protein [Enterobacter cancerogenus]|uniref:Uncharacterized protein n=1 Tax=Enterobacter cancerogenus TaxID=69218 RepID=A0A484Z934_9ENTR|nr:Uncharacterised protein [Enterobacter cancerogenus]
MLLDRPSSPGMIPQPRSTTARALTGRSAPWPKTICGNTGVQRRQGIARATMMNEAICAVQEGSHGYPVDQANI